MGGKKVRGGEGRGVGRGGGGGERWLLTCGMPTRSPDMLGFSGNTNGVNALLW